MWWTMELRGKILKNFRNRIMNYIRIFCPKIMKILMEILHMHRKCWENTEKYLPFFIQNFMARLLMRLKKKHGILRLYLNCFWKSILHLRRKKFLLRNRWKKFSFPMWMTTARIWWKIGSERRLILRIILWLKWSWILIWAIWVICISPANMYRKMNWKQQNLWIHFPRGKLMRWHVLIQKAIGWDLSQEEKILQRRKRLIYVIILALSVW